MMMFVETESLELVAVLIVSSFLRTERFCFFSVQLTIIIQNIAATKYLIVYNFDLQDTAIRIYSLGITSILRLSSTKNYKHRTRTTTTVIIMIDAHTAQGGIKKMCV